MSQDQPTRGTEAWLPDPVLESRLRYFDGKGWTSFVSECGETYEEPYLGEGHCRWQYGVINIGMFSTMERMQAILGVAGSNGWQLVHVFDKGSNWSTQMEKGFMILRRPVPAGVRLADDEWCVTVSLTMFAQSKGRQDSSL